MNGIIHGMERIDFPCATGCLYVADAAVRSVPITRISCNLYPPGDEIWRYPKAPLCKD